MRGTGRGERVNVGYFLCGTLRTACGHNPRVQRMIVLCLLE